LGISESVRWLGELKASEMPAFYRACDVIVVPSLTTTTWKEQFGRVPVEAMSCGVPAVVSNSGSLPEVMSNVGIIADEHDPRSWLQALYALAIDEPEYAEISKRGIELVRERYTWSRVAAAMKDLYQQAIATKNAVPHQKLFALR
jgi:glycosyltransferase involved in cell wall biosynthesis